jgi:hypothetical protein
MIASDFVTETRRKATVIVMTCMTMNDISERNDAERSTKLANAPVRLLGLGYSIAAVALRLKNKPALRLMTVASAAVVLAVTLLSSHHMNRASLAWCLLFLAINISQLLHILWELRPIALQGEAKMLHDLVFPNLTAPAFNKPSRETYWLVKVLA